MDPTRWQKVQELFAAALERPPERRASFLAERCGDDEPLRREVEDLLRAECGSDSFVGRRIGRGVDLLGATPASPPPVGSIAEAGKYELLLEIGQGGFGVVYEGWDPDLQRKVAVKTCTSRDADQRERFFREGRIAAGLRHPNITLIYDVGFEGDVPYLVQEYLPGRDLSDLIAEGTLSTSAKLDLLLQIAAGLAYAHERGVLHRDVKPANVRVLDDGTPSAGRASAGRASAGHASACRASAGHAKILDFGIARLLHSAETRLTYAGAMIGTVGYLAPEQLRGDRVDPRADVFSFGVLAYELLSGVRPFAGKTFGTVSYRMLYTDPEPLHVAWPECPDRRLSRIVGRCLEKSVNRRWPSIDEVAAALREVGTPASKRAVVLRRAGIGLAGLVPVAVAIWLGVTSPDELTRPELGEPLRAPTSSMALATSSAGKAPPPQEEADKPPEGSEDASESPSQEDHSQESDDGATAQPTTAQPTSTQPRAETDVGDTKPADAAGSAGDFGTEGQDEQSAAVDTAEATETGDPPEEAQVEPHEAAMRLGDPITAPGPEVTPPRILEFVEPVYPKRARRRRQAARVIVAVYVDETGQVIDTLLKQKDDSGLGFNEAAVDAARHTRFEPATRDGVAGRMWTQIPYDFSVRR